MAIPERYRVLSPVALGSRLESVLRTPSRWMLAGDTPFVSLHDNSTERYVWLHIDR
jgi:hypothetical protein